MVMSVLVLALNLLWLFFGGFLAAMGWFLAGLIMVVTIIGIPFARAAFNMGLYTFWPFGREAVFRDELTGQEDLGTGPLGFFGNIVWFVCAGWWLALGHLAAAAGLAITIVGIPFAWAHLKLAGFALWPIGRRTIDIDRPFANGRLV